MRRVAAILLLTVACGGTSDPPPPPPAVATTGLEVWDGVVGLDVRQVAGSDTIDYIIDSLGAGAAWLDYDGDGDADLYLAQGATRGTPVGPPDVLLRNDTVAGGPPTFVDVTEASGLGDTRWSFGVAVADYDGDDDPDIFLTNWGADRLYRNDGGVFVDVAVEAGVADEGWGTSAAWSDIDGDGDLDLYVARYVEFSFERYPGRGEGLAGGGEPCMWRGLEVFCGPRNLQAATDLLYRNDGGTFVEIGREAGIADGAWFGLAVHFLDADGDGDDDLYVANDSLQNTYFVNDGTGRFEETAIFAGLAYNEQGTEQAGMGIDSADYDRDGDVDLVVSNFSHDHHTLYRGEGDGWWSDGSYAAGLGTGSHADLGWGVLFADLDHDGWDDLYVAHGHVYPQVDGVSIGTTFRQGDGVWMNDRAGGFVRLGPEDGSALAVTAGSRTVLPEDLDGDGDLDLLVTRHNEAPLLIRNDRASGHWLQVELDGDGMNRDGIGARVEVAWTAADGSTVRVARQVRREASYLGSRRPFVHFGLGDAVEVDRLVVRWPSGVVTEIDDPGTDRRVVIGPNERIR